MGALRGKTILILWPAFEQGTGHPPFRGGAFNEKRSTKKTSGSGGKGKFNPDCFFDVSAFAAIILSQFVN
jgi:hypothetical protein